MNYFIIEYLLLTIQVGVFLTVGYPKHSSSKLANNATAVNLLSRLAHSAPFNVSMSDIYDDQNCNASQTQRFIYLFI